MRTKRQIVNYIKKYYKQHRKKILLYNKNYKKQNHNKIKQYYLDNKDEIIRKVKRYYKLHITKILKQKKEYRLKNKKEIANKAKITAKKLYHSNIQYKVKQLLRRRILDVLKGNPKLRTTKFLVGCSIKQLKQHLESKFTRGMSWNNHGKWHIDHIKPCCMFDLSKLSEQRKCFRYTNLQPLWAKDNLRKNKLKRG